jgi:hypothetical protein
VRSDEGVEAVLDSKYYAEGKNPLKGNWSRSRLLSYGFHLEAQNLAMVAPLAENGTFEFKGRDGELTIISPESEEFTTEGLRTSLQEYLRNQFGEQRGTTATTDLQNRTVCHPEVEASDLESIIQEDQLRPEAIMQNTRRILDYIVRYARLSDVLHPRQDAQRSLKEVQNFKDYLQQSGITDWDIVIPFFISANDPGADAIVENEELVEKKPELVNAREYIRIHCLEIDAKGRLSNHYSPPPFGLSW